MIIHTLGTAGELHFDPEGNYLMIKWKKLFQRHGANRQLVEKLLEEVEQRRVSKVLIDMTESSGAFPDDFIEWAQGPGMIKSAEAGVRHYVTLEPAPSVAKISVARWQDVAAQNVNGIEVTSTPSRKTAVAWLTAH
jgi:hypothetical protein